MSFLETVPWFLPGLLVSIGFAIIASKRVSAELAVSRAVATAGVASLGLIVSATLSPLREALESGATSGGACDLSRVWLASVAELMAVSQNDTLLNVLLFVPLGLGIGLVRRRGYGAALMLAAVLLPFVIESIQLLVPSLARACESADVVDNETGLALGIAMGWLLARTRP